MNAFEKRAEETTTEAGGGEVEIPSASSDLEQGLNFYMLLHSVKERCSKGEPVKQQELRDVINLAASAEQMNEYEALSDDLIIEKADGTHSTLGELRETGRQRERADKFEALFRVCHNREEMESVLRTSTLLEHGLAGSGGDVYSREMLLVLLDGAMKGDIAIDHLPRTAGFREAVGLILAREKLHMKTWDEMKSEVKAEAIDEHGDLVHDFDPSLIRTEPNSEDKKTFKSLVEIAKNWLKRVRGY